MVKCIFISVLRPFLPFLAIYGFWYGFSNIVSVSQDVDDDSSVFHSVQHWKGLRNCTHLSVIHLPVYLFWNFTIQFKQLERDEVVKCYFTLFTLLHHHWDLETHLEAKVQGREKSSPHCLKIPQNISLFCVQKIDKIVVNFRFWPNKKG